MKIKKITAAVLMSAAVLSLAGCGKDTSDSSNNGGLLSKSKTLDVSDYAVIEIEGYDTAGKSTCTIDFDGIVNDNLELFGINALDTGKINEIKKDLKLCLDAAADKTEELSNGETIHVTWDIKNADAFKEKHDVVLEGTTAEKPVEGLMETITLDVFDYIELSKYASFLTDYALIKPDDENGAELYKPYEAYKLYDRLSSQLFLRLLDENGEITAVSKRIPKDVPEEGYEFTYAIPEDTLNDLHKKSGIIPTRTEQTYIYKDYKIERKN